MLATWMILTAIFILFILFVALKNFLPAKMKKQFCALCTAVSLTWAALLVLSWLGKYDNMALLSLLMGSTVLGVYYILEKKLLFFKIPLYLSLLFLAYLLLPASKTKWEITLSLVVLGSLWALHYLIYSYKNNPRIKKLVDKVIACCKAW